MKKYVLQRILRSILSILIVTTIAFVLVYSLVPRQDIFVSDPTYTKLKAQPDELLDYENVTYQSNGYLDYYNPSQLCTAATSTDAEYTDCVDGNGKQYIDAWAQANSKWVVNTMPMSGKPYATREIPTLEKVVRFYGSFLQIDHPWRVQDASNPDLSRGLGLSMNENVGLAVTCDGCESKNQLYINGTFPFIHQNFIKINLGKAYPTYKGQDVTQVIGGSQGSPVSRQVTFETGKTGNSALDFGTCKYRPSDRLDRLDKENFNDNYTDCLSVNDAPSMLSMSFITGVMSVILAYAIAVPAGVVMARKKGMFVDRFGVAIITVLISVPSLASVYFFRMIGSSFFGMPENFPTLGPSNPLSYVMPTIILALLSVSGIMMWIRRYMIDQQSADYVKFAKAKGLSDKEISKNHIFKNAIIPITAGIPASVIGAIAGATITEQVFAMPGMGKMLPDAILQHNNAIVIGLVFIFTTMSIISVLLGDILLTKVDPRIKLDTKGGK
ncbi:ABC transporter permease [Erysipelothrix sp. HDW6B]|uniref:ABC transporter permease n=1 Tax=Erysipelothrix TaxID=1647 RepID=UPI00135C90F4|nr:MULTISPECIES: ABC transporter permease [Erysipelothrix]QIK85932.1 ABC transporter permease [Erysipelothrix sp. HDW6B]